MPRVHPAPPEQTAFQRAHEAALHLTAKELEELAAIALCRAIWLRGARVKQAT